MSNTRRPWDQTFADLSAWLETHGRMPAPGGDGDEETRLATWASIQRRRARNGRLPASQSSRLATLLGDLTSRSGQELYMQQMVEWVTANGRLPRMTNDPARADENMLGHRLRRLMKTFRDGTARLHHLEALLSIPGCLEGQERTDAEARISDLRNDVTAVLDSAPPVPVGTARWEASFADLQAWVASHGAVPRRRTSDGQESKLANWLNVQRTHSRNNTLSPDREASLRTISGALETKQSLLPSNRIADLAAFRNEHGRLPSELSPDPVEMSLGRFLSNLRSKMRRGTLSADLTAEAESVLGVITGGNRTAEAMLEEYTDYVTRHGYRPDNERDKTLYNWSFKAAAGRVGGAEAPAIQGAVQKIRAAYPPYGLWHAITRFEEYTEAHGHLPPAALILVKRFREATLASALLQEATPEAVKDRIRAILEFPAYKGRPTQCRLGDECRMNRKGFDAAVKERGVWLPEAVFLSLLPPGFSRTGSIEELAEELEAMTLSGAIGKNRTK